MKLNFEWVPIEDLLPESGVAEVLVNHMKEVFALASTSLKETSSDRALLELWNESDQTKRRINFKSMLSVTAPNKAVTYKCLFAAVVSDIRKDTCITIFPGSLDGLQLFSRASGGTGIVSRIAQTPMKFTVSTKEEINALFEGMSRSIQLRELMVKTYLELLYC